MNWRVLGWLQSLFGILLLARGNSSTSAWKIPWMEEPGRLQSTGSLRVGQNWATSLSCIGEGNGNPLQCSCLENPGDGGAWWAAIYGVAQSRTRLKWLSSSSSSNAPTNPCYHHIDAAYDCCMYYQLSNPFCLCLGQQAITCSAGSTRRHKTTANHGKWHTFRWTLL